MLALTAARLEQPIAVELFRGSQAIELLQDPSFRAEWTKLLKACPWATSCQSMEFSDVWFSVYGHIFEPLLVVEKDREGGLGGLLPLAIAKGTGELVHVGAHHAEYQAWVSMPANGNTFIVHALDALEEGFPGKRLRLQYLPPGTPLDWCVTSPHWTRRVIVTPRNLPLLALGPGSRIDESLRKKSNKSRINRLQRIKQLSLVQMHQREDLERVIDTIADFCDLRQGAVNGALPFKDDPCKREFYLRLLDHPGLLHAGVLMLGDEVVAANLGLISNRCVSIGVLAHSPFLAEHSPGKVLIMLLARELGRDGFSDLDLTPGGDTYKERSADHWDVVHTLSVHFSPMTYAVEAARTMLKSGAARLLGSHRQGVTNAVRNVVRMGPWAALRSLASPRSLPDNHADGWEWFILEKDDIRHVPDAALLAVNRVSDLLDFRPARKSRDDRGRFLAEASRRLEAGGRCYTLSRNGTLVHCSWLILPDAGDIAAGSDSAGFRLLLDDPLSDRETDQASGHVDDHFQVSLCQRVQDASCLPGVNAIIARVRAEDGSRIRALKAAGFRPFSPLRDRQLMPSAEPGAAGPVEAASRPH